MVPLSLADDNIDETYGVNVQFESDEEVREALQLSLCCLLAFSCSAFDVF